MPVSKRKKILVLPISQAEDWGDPAVPRYSLDMVWSHLGGRPLAADELARLTRLVEVATPHMDDFDANEVLSACVMVIDELRCCLAKHHRLGSP